MTPTIRRGYKTTEFWVTVLTAVVGLLVTLGYIDPAQAHGAGLAAAIQVVGGILGMAVPVAVYAISRALVKAPAAVVPALTVLPGGLAVGPAVAPVATAPATAAPASAPAPAG
ncbi:MAG: hypothetical protein M3Z98_07025 [Candidatus Dormibacteraeota bacterium]|nr:hypothetical protein [Candidatus Dormibacteraeota bacterium]